MHLREHTRIAMPKTVRDEQIVVRISGSLRSELEAAAEQDSRPLGSLIRKVLIDYAVGRVAERVVGAETREAA